MSGFTISRNTEDNLDNLIKIFESRIEFFNKMKEFVNYFKENADLDDVLNVLVITTSLDAMLKSGEYIEKMADDAKKAITKKKIKEEAEA